MAQFGRLSKAILGTCDTRLVDICYRVIPYYDFTVLSGHRNEAAQNALFAAGRSRLKYPESRHNTLPLSMAVDIAPWRPEAPYIDWNDTASFCYLAGMIMQAAADMDVELRWGGNWDRDGEIITDQTFQDLGHFEIWEL